jgi:anti-anti-sigma factor
MSNVDFVDSAGLVALIAGLKAANRHGCRLAICSLRPPIRLIFEITQLDRAFEIFDSLADLADAGFHNVEHFLSLNSQPAAA